MTKLQELCKRFAAELLARRTATQEELTSFWPGGAENPAKDLWGWIMCFANYTAFRRRRDSTSTELQRQAKQREILKALSDEPEELTLSAYGPDGTNRSVTVHPKGYVALCEIHNRNLILASMADDAEKVSEHGTANDVELLVRVYAEMAYLQRVNVWIAITPGPGLPFPEKTARPEPPADLADFHPADLFAISTTFQRVNVMRLAVLDNTRSRDARPDWSVFFATLAESLNVPTASVMRDMTLSGAVAGAAERARAREQASAMAKKEQAAKTTPPLDSFRRSA